MRSVPPRGSGWVVASELSTEIKNQTVNANETHPLPRGGTDLKRLRSLRLIPGVNRFAAREIVKDQINPREHFRKQNDLSGVHREMLGHMEDRGEGGRAGALDLIFIKQS